MAEMTQPDRPIGVEVKGSEIFANLANLANIVDLLTDRVATLDNRLAAIMPGGGRRHQDQEKLVSSDNVPVPVKSTVSRDVDVAYRRLQGIDSYILEILDAIEL